MVRFVFRQILGCGLGIITLLLGSDICVGGWQIKFIDVSVSHLPPPNEVSQSTMDVKAADLDNDGDLDLVLAGEFQANTILINDGTGRFSHARNAISALSDELMKLPPGAPVFLKEGHDSEDIAIADLDGNGTLDIVIVSEDDVRIGRKEVHEYYINRGDGSFDRREGALPDSEANGVDAADVNGDGAIDLYICGAEQDQLLINDGKGGFTDQTKQRLPEESYTGQDVKLVDVTGDGKVDIVVGNEGGHLLFVNNGEGLFRDETKSRIPSIANVEARKVTPVDFDHDGDLDLYFSHVGWISPGTKTPRDPQDRLLLNDGTGVFEDVSKKYLHEDSLTTLDAKFLHLDDDQHEELIQINFGLTRVLSRRDSDRFVDITDRVFDSPIDGPGVCVEAGDFNGDGVIDLYIGLLAGPNRNPQGFDRLLFGKKS